MINVFKIKSCFLPQPDRKETLDCLTTDGPSQVNLQQSVCIFSHQASLAQQAFLITPLHGARYKTGKNAYAKK